MNVCKSSKRNEKTALDKLHLIFIDRKWDRRKVDAQRRGRTRRQPIAVSLRLLQNLARCAEVRLMLQLKKISIPITIRQIDMYQCGIDVRRTLRIIAVVHVTTSMIDRSFVLPLASFRSSSSGTTDSSSSLSSLTSTSSSPAPLPSPFTLVCRR